MAHQGSLRAVNRHIATHDPTTGHSTWSTELPSELTFHPVPTNQSAFALSYGTDGGVPVDLNDDADLATYKRHIPTEAKPALIISNGTSLHHVDFAPGCVSPLHRTVSLDYAVVLEGEMEAVLEDGETRRLRRGDTVVHRGTMHAWRNPSDAEWARMLFVMIDCKPVEVAGKTLEKEFRAPPASA